MRTEAQETPPPLVLRGLQALEYASRHRSAQLFRRGLFGARPEPLGLESAYLLADRGASDQLLVEVGADS